MNTSSVEIVRAPVVADSPTAWSHIAFEPAFHAPGRELVPAFPVPAWRERYAKYLGFRVSSHSRDLLAHVRRVLLWAAAGNRSATYRAATDLFQVLGDKGLDLRRDIMRRISRTLSPLQRATLECQLTVSESSRTVVELPTSRFAPRLEGKLVTLITVPHEDIVRNPLEEARDYLDNGQIQEAQRTLESALAKGVDDPDIHAELLEIYRRARDLKSCERMLRQLGVQRPEVSHVWEETLNLLQDEVDG